MSHCVVESCVVWVWCIRHPQCGSQSPLPVTVARPVGWLLCQRGLRARSVEGKTQGSCGYELQWPSGKFSPATKWELGLWSFSFHTVNHITSVPFLLLPYCVCLTKCNWKVFSCSLLRKSFPEGRFFTLIVLYLYCLMFFFLTQVFLHVLGVIAVAAIIIPWILLPVVPLLAVFLFLRLYFLQTSRDIKRLESTSTFFPLLGGSVGMSICCIRQKQTTGMLIDHWRKPWSLA